MLSKRTLQTNNATEAPKCVDMLLNYNTMIHLQLTLLNPLEQHIAIRVRIHGDLVQRIQLTRTVKHVLIHLTILATQTAIQDPIVETPSIDQSHSMRSDILEQLHNRIRARQLNLMLTARAGCIKLTTLLLQRVQRKQAEEFHQDVSDVLADLAFLLDLLEGGKIVLDDHPLRMCFGEAVEIDEQIVPSLLLLVAVLGGFEGEEGDAPGEGGDEVGVGADDVEGAADVATGLEVGQDGGGVVGGLFVVEDGAGGFEELWDG
jgi:hypothetical protein